MIPAQRVMGQKFSTTAVTLVAIAAKRFVL